jgi:hippurate hydrolase
MIHVTAAMPMPAGMIVICAPGVSAPAADYFTIRVQGKGCHGSAPHNGIDALTAASHILLALQELHARELAPGTEAVLTIGTIQGGTAPNAIADACELRGTIRTYDEQTRAMLKTRMAEISAAVASAYRASATVEFGSGAPTLENDADLAKAVPGWLREILPMVLSAADLPSGRGGGSEDFAYVSQRIPTLMLALSAGNSQEGYTIPLHHPKVRLDETAMPFGTAALAHIAMRWLETNFEGSDA